MRPVNLLPETHRPRPVGGKPGSSYVLLGVLATCLLMVVAYALTANKVNGQRGDAAKAAVEADRLETKAGSLSPFGDFSQVKETRAASVKDLAGGRFDWERLMRELPRVLPARGWLQSVDATAVGAPAGVEPAATSAAGPGAKLVGCVRKQSDVAAMMLRLRRMHRVQDVTLKTSEREGAAQPTFENCGRYFKFDIAVEFAPDVKREPPVGAKRVPASLGGGS